MHKTVNKPATLAALLLVAALFPRTIPAAGFMGPGVSSTVTSAAQALEAAQQAYDNAVTSNGRKVDSAGTQLERAQRESDTLEELQATLDDCTLTATMDGTVTALNATVGSVCSGTVATIQDVSDLTVEVTIPASSVGKLSTGMQCNITSDATGDTVACPIVIEFILLGVGLIVLPVAIRKVRKIN